MQRGAAPLHTLAGGTGFHHLTSPNSLNPSFLKEGLQGVADADFTPLGTPLQTKAIQLASRIAVVRSPPNLLG
jgi:hypothetical protein